MWARCRYKHNWRYHKELRLWLTKEAGTEPVQKTATFERGSYMCVPLVLSFSDRRGLTGACERAASLIRCCGSGCGKTTCCSLTSSRRSRRRRGGLHEVVRCCVVVLVPPFSFPLWCLFTLLLPNVSPFTPYCCAVACVVRGGEVAVRCLRRRGDGRQLVAPLSGSVCIAALLQSDRQYRAHPHAHQPLPTQASVPLPRLRPSRSASSPSPRPRCSLRRAPRCATPSPRSPPSFPLRPLPRPPLPWRRPRPSRARQDRALTSPASLAPPPLPWTRTSSRGSTRQSRRPLASTAACQSLSPLPPRLPSRRRLTERNDADVSLPSLACAGS